MKLYLFLLLSFSVHLAIYGLLEMRSLKPSPEITVIEIGMAKSSSPKAEKQNGRRASPLPAKLIPAQAESHSAPAGDSTGADVGAGDVIQAPKVIKESIAKYPKAAKSAGIEGVVEMQLVIDTDGHVQKADFIRGPGYGLNEAAMEAIKDFVFSPALRKGEKVTAQIIYRYRFILR